jgi:hypothetical protein
MSFMNVKRLIFHENFQGWRKQLISLCQSHELGNFAINLLARWKQKFIKHFF